MELRMGKLSGGRYQLSVVRGEVDKDEGTIRELSEWKSSGESCQWSEGRNGATPEGSNLISQGC